MLKIIGSLLCSFLFSFFTLVLLFLASNIQPASSAQFKPNTRYPIAIHEHVLADNSLSYEQELDLFSDHLKRAFGISKERAIKYAPIIIKADLYTGLSEIRIASLIMTESSFDEEAISVVGAYGSTQIRPEFWEEFCQENGYNMFDFEGNILCGATILTFLMDKYCPDNIHCALEHYNVGRGNLLRSAKYRQAGQRYTKKIERYSDQLSQDFPLYR